MNIENGREISFHQTKPDQVLLGNKVSTTQNDQKNCPTYDQTEQQKSQQ